MLKGLTDEQVQESRLKYGSNVIEEAEPETFLDKVKGQLGDNVNNLTDYKKIINLKKLMIF